MGSKNFWMGFAAGIAAIWVAKNIPVVKDVATPVLTKVGI